MSAPSTNDVLFSEAVSGLFRGWTALQLAVSHGFGGAYCQEKAEWLVYATETWFNENSNIDPLECEEFLEDVLNHEFDLIVDDGSLTEIARKICDFYKLCKEKRFDDIKQEIQKFPVAQVQNCQKVESDDDCEEDEEIEDDSTQPSTSQPSTLPSNQTASHSHSDLNQNLNNNENAMETEEDDGWTVVRKGAKNR
ncbi:hypothetical protein LOTGIDRAFT_231994 [Lottia gigantea]|uniref:Pre-rRNA-processing protein TSR2 homolog n=1 Tax=Lottia gigantea TaxID=225164 RepID=V4AM77_LOTGI|nr:hypothetical protein LOTGIDRAFT_231994 [Lottia gigantea]ESO95835.1 hypothetical protein LOTGIDRAFT_231994 [Lottia gigantea]